MKLPSTGYNISLAWSPCGTYVGVGNKGDVVTVLDLRTGAALKKKKFAYEVCCTVLVFVLMYVQYVLHGMCVRVSIKWTVLISHHHSAIINTTHHIYYYRYTFLTCR